MGWDESADKFVMATTTATGATAGNLDLTISTLQANLEGNVTGDIDVSSGTLTTSTAQNTSIITSSSFAANTVLVRDANSAGGITAKAVTDTQILIGDGTGFTAASLSGDVTMTNAGVVTISSHAVAPVSYPTLRAHAP